MQLLTIKVQNFRSLHDIEMSFYDLTILIGGNDSGKSSILDALELGLSGKSPQSTDFYKEPEYDQDGDLLNEGIAELITIELIFSLDMWEESAFADYKASDGRLYFKREYTDNSPTKSYVLKQRYMKDTLNQQLDKRTTAELNAIMTNLAIPQPTERINNEKRINLIEGFKKTAETTEDFVEIDPKQLNKLLPLFQRYRAMDYRNPTSLITKTLQAVFESVIFEDGGKSPIANLREIEIEVQKKLDTKVSELIDFIRPYSPKISDLKIDSGVDFSKGLQTGDFFVNLGRGLHIFSSIGDGTKRRLLMGIMDWDRQTVAETLRNKTIIRAYDEPDTNLHYDAQRRMFDSINNSTGLSGDEEYRIQTIICTHSLPMLDRAPTKNINLLALPQDGKTIIKSLVTDEDAEIENFLNMMARQLGITNTMLFYERCYIIIEGTTEEYALPILYRRRYGKSMIDEGIRLINIDGSGAWLALLKLLGKNRQHITLSMLDADSRKENFEKFNMAGFDMEIWDSQTFWIGKQTFEDSFPDFLICESLESLYPRRDKFPWKEDDIQQFRIQADKRHREKDKLIKHLESEVKDSCGLTLNKPDFGTELAKTCPLNQIPETIVSLFELARDKAGVV